MTIHTFNIIKWVLLPILLPYTILQDIFGLVVYIYLKLHHQATRNVSKDGIVYFSTTKFAGVSLGYFVFLNNPDDIDCHHEYGHQLQSLILGPLYLILIGIPSAIICSKRIDNLHYYNYPWESWADHLGKVHHTNLSYTREL